MRLCRVARMAAEGGLPSRTDFRVLGSASTDFTHDVSPSQLVADTTSLDTR